ncbi:hypothetical protein AB0B15_14085 [Streptomyces sp. NPDC045456]|uniref:hypothetical protein n=1 Tax=Streptomyces sp. NPDC045456 TaxID=3155254 RepID=UPI0033EED801
MADYRLELARRRRLAQYHDALLDAYRAYQEQQPIGPDLATVLADAAQAVADQERQQMAGQLEQARRIAVGLENENARLTARNRELERRAVEAGRAEIRQSYAELISQCEQDRDHEGAFDVRCRLREREEQWKREDEGRWPGCLT